jgi:hypothetical protein
MSGAVAPAPPTVDTFAEQCRAEGRQRLRREFISKAAARCIAESLAFEPGLDAWDIAMTYHHSYHRVVWGIENLLEIAGTTATPANPSRSMRRSGPARSHQLASDTVILPQ